MSGEDMRIDTDRPALDHIYSIMHGLNAAMVLKTAVNLDLFDLIEEAGGSATALQVAEKKFYNLDATERILNALTAMNVIEKSLDYGTAYYKNTNSGSLLVKQNPQTVAGLVSGPTSFFAPKMMEELEDTVKGVKKIKEEHEGHGHSHGGHGHSHGGGHGHSHGGHGHSHGGGHGHSHGGHDDISDWDDKADGYSQDMYSVTHNCMVQIAPKLVSAIDLSCHKSALDLGGGSGVLSYALKTRYPDMEVYMNDQENTVQIAKEHFYKGNEHLDIKFLPGDFTKIEIPNVDLFIMSRVLHHVDEPGKFLDTLYNHLNPGGAILLLESVLRDDKTGPLPTLMWDLFMMTHAGPDSTSMRQKSAVEYRTILAEHGFSDVKVVRTEEYCEYDIIYARKV